MYELNSIKTADNNTNTGATDYQFYRDHGRSLRSEAVWDFIKGLFSDK